MFLMLWAAQPLQAQREVMENTFYSVSVGGNTYQNENVSLMEATGFHVSFAVGYHLSNTVSLRAQAQVVKFDASAAKGLGARQAYGHADLMWNLINCFKGYNANRRFALQPYLGFGVAHAQGDNDFCITAGVQLSERVGRSVDLYLEAASLFLPAGFNNNGTFSLLPTATAGIALHLNENNQYNGDRSDTPKPQSDWYVGLGMLGINSFQYSGIGSFSDRLHELQPAMGLSIGKEFTPCWGGRVLLSGSQCKYTDWFVEEPNPVLQRLDGQFRCFSMHADLMFNMVQAFRQQRHMPRCMLDPYMGAGVLFRSDYPQELHFSMNAGLNLRLMVSRTSDIFLDVRYAITEPTFAHINYTDQHRFGVGIATVTAGYMFNFGQFRYRRFQR